MSTSWYIISCNFGGRIMNVTALIEVILLKGAPKPPWPGRGKQTPPPPRKKKQTKKKQTGLGTDN